MDLKLRILSCLAIILFSSVISTNGFFFFPNQFFGDKSSAGIENTEEGRNDANNNNNFQLKSILPHRIQATLSKQGEEPTQGSEENGGIGKFGRKVLKGVQSSVSQIMKAGSSLLNREQSSRALDMEDEFIQQTSENESFMDRVQTIFPGTLWCGGGNKARSDDELGRFADTDNCCRAHDMCPDNIEAGEAKHGLNNSGLFTRSHCDCDQAFYKCLKEAGSIISRKIAFTYFTVLGPQCFAYDYPVLGCAERNLKKCIRYNKDENSEKTWQWFDNDLFLM